MDSDPAGMRAHLERLAGQVLPEWEAVAGTLVVRSYPRGAEIFRQGEPDGILRFLRRGIVRLSYGTRDGRRFSKSLLAEGDFVASASALAGGEATFSATAISEVEIEAASYGSILDLMTRHIAWERAARKVFAELARLKEQREFELLTLTAEERWRALLDRTPGLATRVTQAELAALIGITPVALSRIKARTR